MDDQDDNQPSQDSVLTAIDDNRTEIIYFAYGSNLCSHQMLQRCPNSMPIGLGHLPGYKWIINERGYANIVSADVPPPSSKGPADPVVSSKGGVYGLLYLLPPQDEDELDFYEGVPWAYGKVHVAVQRMTDEEGRKMEAPQDLAALAYIDAQRVVGDVPNQEYIRRMERGIKQAVEEWGMDETYAEGMRDWLGTISVLEGKKLRVANE
ncbi:uncharacterized protein J7T54_000804 [Emericellopsis cladophorae]|uniref:gamma-glutamylcyclotransferase n=1 Tax=Emericellopsis cladophorae TaxID=2686198 RepID=A0A9Q0BBE5_9HYPO|nr:uncharacterized protein J7T54_000804 [Emericellopsis cladophorae]KAI6778415.1 hypothetical protein J7T54_000804 [Emericellopsis cladophorae]